MRNAELTTVATAFDDELLGVLDNLRETIRLAAPVPLTVLPSRADVIRAAIISMSAQFKAQEAVTS